MIGSHHPPRCRALLAGFAVAAGAVLRLAAGPYSAGYGDPESGAVDEPVPGFVGPAGDGIAPYLGFDTDQYVNPAFVGWATRVVQYAPSHPELINTDWKIAAQALGPVTADAFHIVSLGDLSAADLAAHATPGSITLEFAGGIANAAGPDFAVFENALGVDDAVFCELAYVEVSSNGVDFARFPAVYENAAPPTPAEHEYWFQDPTNLRNLAGKHFNGYGESWGTPFDLAGLTGHPLIASGKLDLAHIRYVRLVDIPGTGAYTDAASHPIYDAWLTWGSPGFDLEAVGVLHAAAPAPGSAFDTWAAAIADPGQRGPDADPDRDGWPNLLAYALGAAAGQPLPAARRPQAQAVAGPPVRFALAFPHESARTGVTLTVEVSSALDATAGWTPIAASADGAAWVALLDGPAPRAWVTAGGGTVTVADATPPAPGAPRFLRLRATLN